MATSRSASFATPADPPYVAVVGSGEYDPELSATAEEVGRAVAEAGAVLVCGGLGGVMEAAARGAASAGGLTVGLLPDDQRGRQNPHVAVALPTGLGELRNMLVVRCADAVVAVGGEFGTLSEIAWALRLGTPVVGLGTWELSKPGLGRDPIERAESPAAAVARALELAGRS